jgi:hypothetical protein
VLVFCRNLFSAFQQLMKRRRQGLRRSREGLTVSVLISDGGDRIDPGDEQDREVMTGEFIKLGVSPEQIAIHWKQARRDIEKDLRSPGFE